MNKKNEDNELFKFSQKTQNSLHGWPINSEMNE